MTRSEKQLNPKCPLCLNTIGVRKDTQGDALQVNCKRRCGRYLIDRELAGVFLADRRADRPQRYLSCFTREATEAGRYKHIKEQSWESQAAKHHAVPYPVRLGRLLRLLSKRAETHSEFVPFSGYDRFLVNEPDLKRYWGMMKHLVRQGWIQYKDFAHERFAKQCEVTFAGWQEYERAERLDGKQNGSGRYEGDCYLPSTPATVREDEEATSSDYGATDDDPPLSGPEFKRLREKLDLPQDAVAKELQIPPSSLSRIENDKDRKPGKHGDKLRRSRLVTFKEKSPVKCGQGSQPT